MLYESYQQKMQKIANVIATAKRFRILIISIVAFIIALTATLLSTRGIIMNNVNCPQEIIYGESYEPNGANAFLSRVFYQYKNADSDSEWTTQKPVMPGIYQVRAVAHKTGGGLSYSEISTFTINKKSIIVTINESQVVYGDMPTVTAELSYNDTIVCNNYTYTSLLEDTSEFTPKLEDIIITDESGNIVNDAYSIEVSSKFLDVTERNITLKTGSISVVYDAQAHAQNQYEITSGSLAFSDEISLSLNAFVIKATDDLGVENTAEDIKITTAGGEDATHKYKITADYGRLVVSKRKIDVKTESNSNVYDGVAHSYIGFTISDETPLCSNHTATGKNFLSFLDADVYLNEFDIDLFDENNSLVNDNYEINFDYGSIEISKRPLAINTKDKQKIYDGQILEDLEPVFDSEQLVFGHKLSLVRGASIINATDINGVENKNIYSVLDALEQDVTKNYQITYNYGRLYINKKSVKLLSESKQKYYDGLPISACSVLFLDETSFAENEFVEFTFITSFIDATQNEFNEFTVSVYNSAGTSTYDNYDIDFEFGLLTIYRRPITISTRTHTKEYDGEPLFGYAPEYDGFSIAPGFEYLGDAVVSGEEIELEADCIAYSCYDAGEGIENKLSFKILRNGENIADKNYDITYNYGTLTIIPRPVLVEILSAQKYYDATPLVSNESLISYRGGSGQALIGGDKYEISTKGEITDAGEEDNCYQADSFKVFNNEGDEVTLNYQAEVVDGILKIHKRPVEVFAIASSFIYDGKYHNAEFDVRLGEFDMQIEDLTNQNGLINIYENDHNNNPVLKVLHFINGIEITSAKTYNVNDYEIYINKENIRIYELQNNEDVTNNYSISVYDYNDDSSLKLTIEKRPIQIKTESQFKTYDGEPLVSLEDYVSITSLVEDDDVAIVSGEDFIFTGKTSITNVKESTLNRVYIDIYDIETNQSTYYNYRVEEAFGEIIIKQRPITIKTATGLKSEYDGEKLVVDNPEIIDGNLVLGHNLLLASEEKWLNDSFINATSGVENKLVYCVVDENFNDLTDNYNLSYEYGTLVIGKRPVYVESLSAEKYYDGKYFSCEEYVFLNSTSFIEGHEPELEFVKVFDAGEYENKFSAISGDENYEIEYTYGKLTINKRYVTINTGNKDKEYDGTPLYGYVEGEANENIVINITDDYDIEGEALCDGDELKLIDCSYAIDCRVGYGGGQGIENVITFEIWRDGRDISSKNYEIEYEYGALVINKRQTIITIDSEEKYYDAMPLTKTTFTYDKQPVLDHEFSLTIDGTITNYGEQINTYKKNSFKVLSGGQDVSYNYDVTIIDGILKIHKRPIKITTFGSEYYRGEEIVASYKVEIGDFDIMIGAVTGEPIIDNQIQEIKHDLKVEEITKAIKAGKYDIEFKYDIIDNNKATVKDNYFVELVSEGLEILKRPIIISTKSHNKVYDALYLSALESDILVESCLVDVMPLAINEEIIVDTTSLISITNVKESCDNVIEFYIYSKTFGEDTTENYEVIEYNYGKLEIFKRRVNVSTQSLHKQVYDGLPLKSEITQDNYITDEFVSGHKPQISQSFNWLQERFILATDSQGRDNEISVIIVDDQANDYSDNYDVIYNYGKLYIGKRYIEITCDSVAKRYNGIPLVANSSEITGGSLADTDESSINYFGTQLIPGESVSSISSITITNTTIVKTVTQSYEIVVVDGLLTVEKGLVEVTASSSRREYNGEYLTANSVIYDKGSLAESDELCWRVEGSVLFGEADNVITECYIKSADGNISEYYDIVTIDGKLEVTKRVINLRPKYVTKVYDGKPLVATQYSITHAIDSQPLVKGHYLDEESLVYTGEKTDAVGFGDSSIQEDSVHIFDENGQDVLFYYDVKISTNKLVVTKRPIKYSSSTESKIFDGKLLQGEIIFEDNFVSGHYVSEYISSFIMFKGETKNLLDSCVVVDYDGNDVTGNYSFVANEIGTLKIEPISITITTGSKEFYYNGQEQSFEDWHLTSGELLSGHTIYATNFATIRQVGSVVDNTCDIVIFSEEGFSVTDGYEISFINGVLKMAVSQMSIWPSDIEKYYDGTPLEFTQTHSGILSTDGLLDKLVEKGYTYDVIVGGSLTEAGTANSTIESFILYDPNGEIVENIDFSYELGTIKVNKRPIKVKLKSYSKIYDGEPLVSAGGYDIVYLIDSTIDGLVNGHSISFEIYGEQIEYGYSYCWADENSCVITDQEGINRYENYDVVFDAGLLSVEKQVIEVYLMGKTFVYDGKPHYYEHDDYYILSYPSGATLLDLDLSSISRTMSGSVAISELESLDYIVYNNDVDVTENFEIEFLGDTLTIEKRKITITSASETKKYDGATLQNSSAQISFGTLCDGHTIEVVVTGSIVDVGNVENTIQSVNIFDENSYNITSCYDITEIEGMLKIVE